MPGVKVMPVTVLGSDGTGTDSDIIEGVVYAVDHGADVINMSFSNPGFSTALQAAIDYAWAHNVVVVAATGNDGSTTATFPAGDRGVIGVSNTDQNDALNASSNSRRGHVPRRAGHRHRDPGGRRRHHVGHRHVGLLGRGRGCGRAAARLGSGCLEWGHRRAAGTVGRRRRHGRSDGERAARISSGRSPTGTGGPAGRGCSGGEWRADRRAVRGGGDHPDHQGGPRGAVPGITLNYTITATGNGNQGNITITDAVPPALIVGTVTGSGALGNIKLRRDCRQQRLVHVVSPGQ